MTEELVSPCEFDREKLVLRMDVTISADPNSISPVVRGILELAREMKCAEGKEFEIGTALREALSNAIIHGCGKDPNKKVQFCVVCDVSRGMLIVVRDPGPGFDPDSIPDPTVGLNVFSEHGRGIFLINQLMDDVAFEKGGTQIRMKKL